MNDPRLPSRVSSATVPTMRRIPIQATPVTPELDAPLHIKYRPTTLADVVGQDAVVKSLRKVIEASNPGHAYLFVGPAGTGKTTLARILGSHFGCEAANVMEVDAASATGIDAMRQVVEGLRYKGFGDTPNRLVIVDECHGLSKAAWTSLLKTVEQPPDHVFFAFCTTESGKVPDTILTRCHTYTLKPVKHDDLMDLLTKVCDSEGLQTPDPVLDAVARASGGSPRQALVMLSQARHCSMVGEAVVLLEAAEGSAEIIDLCRLIVDRKLTWDKFVATLKAVPDVNPESVRIVMVNYLASCLLGSKSEGQTVFLLELLSHFRTPFAPSDKMAPLLYAVGNILYP